jgi:translation elongation factor EF-Tu-like GTPase
MPQRLYPTDDFEAVIRIYGPAEGGRRIPAFNGIRWDFAYDDAQPDDTLYMIWPDFLAPDASSVPPGQPLPSDTDLPARMTIVVDEMRPILHQKRIAPGTRFFCHEGPRRVAQGVVTRITGLFTPRQPPAATRPSP